MEIVSAVEAFLLHIQCVENYSLEKSSITNKNRKDSCGYPHKKKGRQKIALFSHSIMREILVEKSNDIRKINPFSSQNDY